MAEPELANGEDVVILCFMHRKRRIDCGCGIPDGTSLPCGCMRSLTRTFLCREHLMQRIRASNSVLKSFVPDGPIAQ